MFLRSGLGQMQIDACQTYVPLLVPREPEAPAVTGANSLLAAAGLTALGLVGGLLLKGPKQGKDRKKK